MVKMKPLEDWEDMERQQSSAISDTTESLLSIICRIPLKDCVKVKYNFIWFFQFMSGETPTEIFAGYTG